MAPVRGPDGRGGCRTSLHPPPPAGRGGRLTGPSRPPGKSVPLVFATRATGRATAPVAAGRATPRAAPPCASDRGVPTVDDVVAARDERRLVRQEEGHEVRDLL